MSIDETNLLRLEFVDDEVLDDLEITSVEAEGVQPDCKLMIQVSPYEAECSGKHTVTFSKKFGEISAAFIIDTVNHTISNIDGYSSNSIAVEYYDQRYEVGVDV